ncbi:hypothetical protein HQ489_02845 [Candidatus Woesearchaeota archaeon]|nr:hypothetical protein [Candidatus Woesearchaeota archaeon]
MFKFLKNLFKNDEPKKKDVPTDDLQLWLDHETSKHEFNGYIEKYLSKVGELKSMIFEKNKILEVQEIPDKHKGVEARVQNIVVGHRDNYVKEVFRFTENLSVTENLNFSDSIKFNNSLNGMIDELAKKTGKSHEATEHLFAKDIEPIFKSIGELNILVKKFSEDTHKLNIHEILKIQELITQLHEDDKKKKEFNKLINESKEEQNQLQQDLEILNKRLMTLNESEEFKEFQKLQEENELLNKNMNRLDHEIHSYFSRLQKPFRKYERLASHNKTLKAYLEDSVIAFKEDKDLDILVILQALITNINIFNFDERQETNFLEMIEDGSSAYFKILHNREEDILHKKDLLLESLNKINVMNEIKDLTDEISKLEEKLNSVHEIGGKIDSKLQHFDTNAIKNEIVTRSKELLNVELNII